MARLLPHSTKRKAAFVEAVVAQIQAYGVARQVLPLLMEGEDVEIAMDCGCTFGAPRGAPSYQACSSHRSSSAPRVCFCGLNFELTEATRRAYKPFSRLSEEKAEQLRRRRIEHFAECCKTPWKADEVPEAIEDTELEEPSMLSDDEILRRLFPEEADHA